MPTQARRLGPSASCGEPPVDRQVTKEQVGRPSGYSKSTRGSGKSRIEGPAEANPSHDVEALEVLPVGVAHAHEGGDSLQSTSLSSKHSEMAAQRGYRVASLPGRASRGEMAGGTSRARRPRSRPMSRFCADQWQPESDRRVEDRANPVPSRCSRLVRPRLTSRWPELRRLLRERGKKAGEAGGFEPTGGNGRVRRVRVQSEPRRHGTTDAPLSLFWTT